MSWIAAGVATASAVMGTVNANNQRKSQQKANEVQGEISGAQMAMSPWTKIGPQEAKMGSKFGPSALGGAIQGGLGGAMFAKQNEMGSFAPKPGEEKMDKPGAPPGSGGYNLGNYAAGFDPKKYGIP